MTMDNIKKLFSFAKRKSLIYLSLLIAIIFALPLRAYAFPWDQILGGIMLIPNVVLNLIFHVLLLLTGALVSLSSWLLTWVTSDNFISFTYTTRANPVIEAGLNVTQSFVNMGIVLALIFIAFAMILRIKGYETIRIFITLIVIALLVNFAPLLCGLIVDASNIAMHYFTQNITGMAGFANVLGSYTDDTSALIKNVLSISGQSQILIKSCVMITINLGVFFALLMFVFIFMLRYIAIWVIVILSPLAFVAYILPLTRKYFFQWFDQLIQWSFIGVIAAFFLYLAEQVFAKIEQLKDGLGASPASSGSGPDALDVGFFENIFPYFVPLAFLFIGIVLSLKTSAAGADVVTKTAKNIGTNIQNTGKKFVGDKRTEAYENLKEKAREMVSEKARKGMERVGRAEPFRLRLGTNKKNLGLKTLGGVANATVNTITSPSRWFTRGVGATALGIRKADEKRKKDLIDKAKNQSAPEMASSYKTGGLQTRKATLLAAAENGKMKDIGDNGITSKEITETTIQTLQEGDVGSYKKIIAAKPMMAGKIVESIKGDKELMEKSKLGTTEEERKQGITPAEKAVKEFVNVSNIDKMDKSDATNPEVIAAIFKTKDNGRFWAKLGEKFGTGVTGPLQEIINGIEITEPGWIEKNKSGTYKHLKSSSAGALGIGMPSGDDKAENNERYSQSSNQNKNIVNNIIASGQHVKQQPFKKDDLNKIFKTGGGKKPETNPEEKETKKQKSTETFFTKSEKEPVRKSRPKNKNLGGTHA